MKRPWMPLYIADFIRDTTHVGPLIKGAYLCLIMHYWNHGSLPDDDAKLRTITGLSPQEWRYHHDTLKAFFRDGWRHKRIDHELAHVADISNKRSAVAAARQEKLRLQNECKQSAIAPPFAPAIAPTLHTTQRSKKELTAKAVRSYDEKFEEAWQEYPNRDGGNPKPPAAKRFLSEVKAGADPQAIIDGVKRFAIAERRNIGTPFIPQMVKWLRDQRWLDYGPDSTIVKFDVRKHLV